MTDKTEQRPESMLPYDEWAEEAMRHVMVRALAFVAAKGMPGAHHFYLTFRTDFPGVVVPDRLRAQYPQEMTIVLQHQFWDLDVDETKRVVSVGLSFGGVATTLRIPFASVTQFVDPHVQYGHRFETATPAAERSEPEPAQADPAEPAAETVTEDAREEAPQVVSLDAFRRRTPPRES